MGKAWLLLAIFGPATLVCALSPASSPTIGRAESAESMPPGAEAKASQGTLPTTAGESSLTTQQRQVAERFRELEKLLLRMAELTAPTDPRRAALLRQAVAQSKQRDIDHQFDQLLELLKQDRLAPVVKGQGEVRQDLLKLLDLLLSEDRSKRIESEKERVRDYLRRVNKIIKEQKLAQAETSRGADPSELAERQGQLAEKTAKLADDVADDAGKKPADVDDKNELDKQGGSPDDHDQKPLDPDSDQKESDGTRPKENTDDSNKNAPADKDSPGEPRQGQEKPVEQGDQKGKKGDSKPMDQSEQSPGDQSGQPSDVAPPDASDADRSEETKPAQKRLEQAQRRMQEAQRKLEESKRQDATEKQAEALKELEQAKAELEEILRQLREEEMTRTLAMLETRFRKMLDQQVEVYEGTKRLDKVAEAERDRDDEIESGRLSRKESQISIEAEKALAVLHEEGSAVAFPEAVVEMRDDMEQVVARLAQVKTGEVTQGIETDIIAALEEMIAALQKAQKEMESKAKQAQAPQVSESDEPPLVDTLSELKMIRALQMRVNLRTERYAKMTEKEQADRPDLIEALKRLAEREQRIHKVTRDIVLGRNQ